MKCLHVVLWYPFIQSHQHIIFHHNVNCTAYKKIDKLIQEGTLPCGSTLFSELALKKLVATRKGN